MELLCGGHLLLSGVRGGGAGEHAPGGGVVEYGPRHGRDGDGDVLLQGAVAAELTGKSGVKPGDRVALWLKNRPEFIPAVFGILSAGAVLVPINNFLKPDEVNYILKDGGIDVLITDDELIG